MFPRKTASPAMTPNQVMGHHRMMMQAGMSPGAIASTMVNLGGSNVNLPSRPSNAPYSAFDGTAHTEEDRQRSVVTNALREMAWNNPAYEEEAAPKDVQEEKKDTKKSKCFLHQKPNKNCKKCQAALKQEEADKEKSQEEASHADASMKANSSGSQDKKELKCSPMLKEQISNSSYYKRLLEIKAIALLIKEINESVDTIDVYNPGSRISPSCFMCHVYRLSMLTGIENDVDLFVDNRKNAVVRCVGFLYLRFATPPLQLWDVFEEYLLDDMQITYNQDGQEVKATVGEYVESLLMDEKYFDSPLPRLPVKVKQLVEGKIAPMLQHRKRMQAKPTSLDGR